jgi:hypothetical protein
VPQQTDEFICAGCFLVIHRSRRATGQHEQPLCRDCPLVADAPIGCSAVTLLGPAGRGRGGPSPQSWSAEPLPIGYGPEVGGTTAVRVAGRRVSAVTGIGYGDLDVPGYTHINRLSRSASSPQTGAVVAGRPVAAASDPRWQAAGLASGR